MADALVAAAGLGPASNSFLDHCFDIGGAIPRRPADLYLRERPGCREALYKSVGDVENVCDFFNLHEAVKRRGVVWFVGHGG